MGTTGTIMGTSQYLKQVNPDIQIIGLQPKEGASIAGIRRWPVEVRSSSILLRCLQHCPSSLAPPSRLQRTVEARLSRETKLIPEREWVGHLRMRRALRPKAQRPWGIQH
jgi:cysteine synthase